jgi:hypothetical protein
VGCTLTAPFLLLLCGRLDTRAGLFWPQRIANAAVQPWRYLLQTAAPIMLPPRYPLPTNISPLYGVHALALALTFAASAACLWVAASRRSRGSLAGATLWTAYLAMLAPSMGLLKHGYDNAGADRYCYLPAWLLVPLAYVALARVTTTGGKGDGPRWWPLVVAGAGVCVLCTLSSQQVKSPCGCTPVGEFLSAFTHEASLAVTFTHNMCRHQRDAPCPRCWFRWVSCGGMLIQLSEEHLRHFPADGSTRRVRADQGVGQQR